MRGELCSVSRTANNAKRPTFPAADEDEETTDIAIIAALAERLDALEKEHAEARREWQEARREWETHLDVCQTIVAWLRSLEVEAPVRRMRPGFLRRVLNLDPRMAPPVPPPWGEV